MREASVLQQSLVQRVDRDLHQVGVKPRQQGIQVGARIDREANFGNLAGLLQFAHRLPKPFAARLEQIARGMDEQAIDLQALQSSQRTRERVAQRRNFRLADARRVENRRFRHNLERLIGRKGDADRFLAVAIERRRVEQVDLLAVCAREDTRDFLRRGLAAGIGHAVVEAELRSTQA